MAKKKGKKSVPVVNKKEEKDIVVKIDKLTGRLPKSTRPGGVIQGKKYRKDRSSMDNTEYYLCQCECGNNCIISNKYKTNPKKIPRNKKKLGKKK